MFLRKRLPSQLRIRKLWHSCTIAVAPLLALASPCTAEGCRLALILALDVSGSVSHAEDRLQREGLAAALLAPEVRRAFLTGGDVAVYVFEWAGAASQVALLPGWLVVHDEADLILVADIIGLDEKAALRAARIPDSGTAVGSALVHAAAAFSAGPACRARTVDVSGDGVNSQGVEPRNVIDALFDDITVNALIIDSPLEDPMLEIQHGGDEPIDIWFQEAVVHGPGSFHIMIDSYGDYQQAMTAKLLREVQSAFVSGLQSAPGAG